MIRFKRLLRLADYLETVKPSKFDMHTWKCGTTACAVGHACTLFKEEGLTLRRVGLYTSLSMMLSTHIPVYKDVECWEAVEKFFGLTGEESKYLFLAGEYSGTASPTTAEVANRIRQFCQERRAKKCSKS